MTFSFQNSTNDLAVNNQQNSIRQAFQLWSDYGSINFTEVLNGGDIQIGFAVRDHGDGFPFDGTNGVLAHAFFPPPNGGGFSGQVHFDDDELWTDLPQLFGTQPIDLVTVAAHEIGHALGLGHSNVQCALMNPFYNGSHRYLSQDDIDGIQSIYGNRGTVSSNNANCLGGTYFINNLAVGANVNWQSSNNLIATVININNQGFITRVGNASGIIRLTAIITLPCGTIVTEFADIIIGSPAPTYINYSIDPLVACNEVLVSTNYVMGSTYTWSFFKQPYNGNNLVQFPNSPASKKLTLTQGSGTYNIGVTADNICGSSNVTFISVPITCTTAGVHSIIKPSTTATASISEDNVAAKAIIAPEVYPNPATNSLTIAVPLLEGKQQHYNSVSLFDMNGKEVKKLTLTAQVTTIDISNLSSGTYVVKIFDGKQTVIKKIIKN